MNALQSLKVVRAIPEAAVRDLPGNVTIAAVLPGEARGAYAEVLGSRRGAEPTRMLIGVNPEASDSAIRESLTAKLLN